MSSARTTTDHEVIRRWAESRQGHPAVVKATHGKQRGSAGLLRIDFDPPEDTLDEVSWDEFFETFDNHGLKFLYQETTDSGDPSRFFKFVSENTESKSTSKSAKSSAKSSANSSKKRSTRSDAGGGKIRQATPQEEAEIEEEEEEELDEERGEDEDEES